MNDETDRKGYAMQQLLHGGSDSVFEVFYSSYQESIERYLVDWVHDRESARELCQETFASFWQLLQTQGAVVQAAAYYKNWLYKTAKHRAIDYLRRKKQIVYLSQSESETNSWFDELVVEGEAERMIDRRSLQEDLVQLPPKQQECLVLMYYRGCMQKEIAEELGISESTVSAYVSKGIAQLRKNKTYHPVTIDLQRAEILHARQAIYELLRGVKGDIEEEKLHECEKKARNWQYRQYMRKHVSELRDDLLVNDQRLPNPTYTDDNDMVVVYHKSGRYEAPLYYLIVEPPSVTDERNRKLLVFQPPQIDQIIRASGWEQSYEPPQIDFDRLWHQ